MFLVGGATMTGLGYAGHSVHLSHSTALKLRYVGIPLINLSFFGLMLGLSLFITPRSTSFKRVKSYFLVFFFSILFNYILGPVGFISGLAIFFAFRYFFIYDHRARPSCCLLILSMCSVMLIWGAWMAITFYCLGVQYLSLLNQSYNLFPYQHACIVWLYTLGIPIMSSVLSILFLKKTMGTYLENEAEHSSTTSPSVR